MLSFKYEKLFLLAFKNNCLDKFKSSWSGGVGTVLSLIVPARPLSTDPAPVPFCATACPGQGTAGQGSQAGQDPLPRVLDLLCSWERSCACTVLVLLFVKSFFKGLSAVTAYSNLSFSPQTNPL